MIGEHDVERASTTEGLPVAVSMGPSLEAAGAPRTTSLVDARVLFISGIAILLVLTLRPQPQGELVGEESVTVKTNECGQRAAVIRIPTVAFRSGDVPDGVAVPDPLTVTNTPVPATTTR